MVQVPPPCKSATGESNFAPIWSVPVLIVSEAASMRVFSPRSVWPLATSAAVMLSSRQAGRLFVAHWKPSSRNWAPASNRCCVRFQVTLPLPWPAN